MYTVVVAVALLLIWTFCTCAIMPHENALHPSSPFACIESLHDRSSFSSYHHCFDSGVGKTKRDQQETCGAATRCYLEQEMRLLTLLTKL
jgi:hypothetical protein